MNPDQKRGTASSVLCACVSGLKSRPGDARSICRAVSFLFATLLFVAIPLRSNAACYDGTYTVPAGVTQVNIDAYGAAGATGETTDAPFGITHGGGVGGAGEWVSVILVPVTPGQVLYYGAASQTVAGGAGGAGNGFSSNSTSGGNGSFVSTVAPGAGCTLAPSAFLVVAAGGGGGGGGGFDGPGGTGGAAGKAGNAGASGQFGTGGGGGGATSSAAGGGGGAGAYFDTGCFCFTPASPGSSGRQAGAGGGSIGGAGGQGHYGSGGGGGGGWFGGGGGGGDGDVGGGGGGGGSSYVRADIAFGHSFILPATQPASVTITPILPGQVTLNMSPNPVPVNGTVTLTAYVQPAITAGTVSFFGWNGSSYVILGSTGFLNNGTYSTTYKPTVAGTFDVYATWSGNVNYNPANSPHQNLVVSTAPTIVTSPSDVNQTYGPPSTFTVVASGVPTPTAQWQVSTDNGASWNNISGATSMTYSAFLPVAYTGYLYRAVVTNPSGSATSAAAKLTIDMATVAVLPKNASMNYGGPLPTIGVNYAINSGVMPPGDPQASMIGTQVCDSSPPMSTTLPPGAYSITCGGATSNNFYIQYFPYSSTLTVVGAPFFTSPASTTFVAQSNASFTVTAAPGYPGATTLSETGTLPAGVTFVDNGNGTATLSGPSGTVGTYPLTFKVITGSYAPVTQNFTLNVSAAAPLITSAASTTFTAGTAGSFTVTTLAYPKATISASGLPSGVTLVDNGNGTATLAGTPAAGTGGTHALTLRASNGMNPDAMQAFTLFVREAPTFTSANATTFAVGSKGTFTVTTSPGYPGQVCLSQGLDANQNYDGLPAHIFLNDLCDGTGVITGTPVAGEQGTYKLKLGAQNSFGLALQDFTLTIVSATPTLTATASAGIALGGQVTDAAILAGGLNPTGTVTYKLFGPGDSACATPLFTTTRTVSGNGAYASAAFSPSAVGTYRWTAAYSGDSNNNASATACSDANQIVVVGKATPTLVGTASASVSVGGSISDSVVLAGGSNATGTITFNLYAPADTTCSGATSFTATTSVAGNGTYASGTFVASTAGVYRWIASYSGDASNAAASTNCSDGTQSVSVTQLSQSISFGSPPGITVGGSGAVTAIGGASGNPVTFSTSSAACMATLAGMVTGVQAGSCAVVAVQAGNTNYAAAPAVTQTFSIGQAASSIALASSPASTVFGQSVMLTATLTSANPAPGGTVAFTEGATPVPGCGSVLVASVGGQFRAQCATSSFGVGTHALTATYSGDANTTGSANASALSLVVTKAVTSVSVTPPAAITLGNSVSVTAAVAITSPGAGLLTGTVTISDGTVSCQAILPATQCSLTPVSAGAKTLTAGYAPDAAASPDFLGSSGSAALTVNPSVPALALVSGTNPSVFGQTIVLTATVTPAAGGVLPTGTLSFSDGATSIAGCTSATLVIGATSSSATCTTAALKAGARALIVNYAGDANNAASSASLTQTVNPAATTTTMVAPVAVSLGGTVTVQVSVAAVAPGAGTPTGTIAVSVGGIGGDSCTIALPNSSCLLVPSSVGTATLSATYSGDANFSASHGSGSLSVETAVSHVQLTSSPNPAVFGQNVTFAATVANGPAPSMHAATLARNGTAPAPSAAPTGTVTFSDGNSVLASVALNAAGVATYATAALDPGRHMITATYSGDASTSAATITAALQVDPAAVPAPALSPWLLILLGATLAGAGVRHSRARAGRR